MIGWPAPRLLAREVFAVLLGCVLFVVAMVVWSSSSGDVKYPSARQ